MIYERTGQMMIRPLLVAREHSPFDLATLFYQQYPDLDFPSDLVDYMRTGYVCSRPRMFYMAKPISHEGEIMWFVRLAIGDLVELLSAMPFYLPKICFCRNNRAEHMRICSTKRLAELAVRQSKLKGNLK